MQIHLEDKKAVLTRVDFHGNALQGIYIELVNKNGLTYFSKRITESERLQLIDTLTRKDNGRAV